uniref:Uncharacterized protein n=1 Tax=Palpitomonas bilix TaxID=652834 RepID=A0A7S3G4N8_9EUKA|mmetsp:Transcript_26027/g.66089  ORF Transcript_26027/g.66089 Transcript_26027/m.66089 type:complete len:111 (+) Transcript_26027:192-524(+)
MRAFALIALFFCFTTCQAVATEQRLGDILAHARGGICRESAIIDFEKIKKVCGTIIADDGYCTERCAVLLANFKINAEACVKVRSATHKDVIFKSDRVGAASCFLRLLFS